MFGAGRIADGISSGISSALARVGKLTSGLTGSGAKISKSDFDYLTSSIKTGRVSADDVMTAIKNTPDSQLSKVAKNDLLKRLSEFKAAEKATITTQQKLVNLTTNNISGKSLQQLDTLAKQVKSADPDIAKNGLPLDAMRHIETKFAIAQSPTASQAVKNFYKSLGLSDNGLPKGTGAKEFVRRNWKAITASGAAVGAAVGGVVLGASEIASLVKQMQDEEDNGGGSGGGPDDNNDDNNGGVGSILLWVVPSVCIICVCVILVGVAMFTLK